MRPQRRAGWFDSWARSEIRDLAALGLGAGVALVGCKSSGSGYDEHHRGGGQSVSNEQVLVWAPPEELASLKAAHPGGELPGEVCARLCGQEAQRNPEGGGVVGCFLRSVPVQNAPAPPRPEADPIDGLVVATEPPTEGAAEVPALSCTVQRVYFHPAGRGDGPARHDGAVHEDACAAWLLETAAREAVSAFAFEDVGKCLGELGLAELARACERAAHEERLHAALLGELLHERGLTPLEVHVFAPKQRTLVDLAADNAREGCVREAFGALVARHQAAHAKDARLAAVLDTIATDEAGHAELSHRIHDALWARLSAQERRQVLAARAEAMASLAGDCANAHGSSLLGHPEASTMVVLFERFAALAA